MAPGTAEGALPARLEPLLFAPANPTSAAVFRVALAIVLAGVFWPRGTSPGGAAARLPGSAGLYDQVVLTVPYWLIILVGLVLFGAGWRPRPLGVLLVVLLAPLALLPEGQLSRHVLLVTLAIFSLVRSDAQYGIRTWRGGALAPSAGPIWPIRLIQLQLSALYGVNALAKTTPAYLSGDVLGGMSVMLPNMRVDLSGGVLAVGSLALPVWLLATASVMIEWVLAIGFWVPRLRLGVALLGVAFHLAVRFVITIFALDVASVFLYLAFLLPVDRPAPAPTPPVTAGVSAPDGRPRRGD